MNEQISSIFDNISFSEEFVIRKVKEIQNSNEIAVMFNISISQSNQLLKYVKIQNKKQKLILDMIKNG